MALDLEDWKRLEEMSMMAHAASKRKDLNENELADAMQFDVLSIAILDLHARLAALEASRVARLETPTYQSLVLP